MVILQDTREQQPLVFNHEFITAIEIGKLQVGDYQVRFNDSFTPLVAFERKGIADLFGTLGKGYKRFKKELERAKASNISIILIIEGSFTKVLGGYGHSTIEGITIIRKLFTLWVKYGVYPVFCKDRDEMSQYIAEFFCALGRKHLEDKK